MGFTAKVAELFVEIGANMAPFRRALGTVQGMVAGVGRRLMTLTPFGGLGAIGGTGAALAYVTKTAIDYERALGQVRKTTGLAGDDLRGFRADLETLSKTMVGVSLNELLSIAEMGGRLGIQGRKNLVDYTKAIAMIRIALDDIPAEEAATAIARILNQFHRGSEDALSFASALNKLDDSTTATGRDILGLTQELSGAASVIGMTPQQLIAFSAALKDAGLETNVAAHSFGQIFGKMATDTAEFAKVAGMSTEEFANLLRTNALDAVKALLKGIGQMEKLEKFKGLKMLSLDGQKATMSLLQLNNVIDRLDGYVATANREWQSHASINAEVAIKAEQAGAQIQSMANSIQIAADAFGAILLPATKQAAKDFADLADAMTDVARSGKETPGWVTASSESLGGLVFSLKHLDDVIEITWLGWKNFLVKLATAPVQWVVNSLQWVADHIRDVFLDAWDMIWFGFKGVWENIKKLFSDPKGFLHGDVVLADPAKAPKLRTPMPDFAFLQGGFEQAMQDLEVKMARDEAEWINKRNKKKPKEFVGPPKPPNLPPEGQGKAPEAEDKKKKSKAEHGAWESLESYAKRLQEDAWKRKTDEEMLKIQRDQLLVQQQQLAALKAHMAAKPAIAI